MTIQPIGKYVLLKEWKREKPQGSLIIPDSADDNNEIYEIIEIGDKVLEEFIDLDVQSINDWRNRVIGKKVLIKRYSNILFKHEDQEYHMTDYENIIAVIK